MLRGALAHVEKQWKQESVSGTPIFWPLFGQVLVLFLLCLAVFYCFFTVGGDAPGVPAPVPNVAGEAC